MKVRITYLWLTFALSLPTSVALADSCSNLVGSYACKDGRIAKIQHEQDAMMERFSITVYNPETAGDQDSIEELATQVYIRGIHQARGDKNLSGKCEVTGLLTFAPYAPGEPKSKYVAYHLNPNKDLVILGMDSDGQEEYELQCKRVTK